MQLRSIIQYLESIAPPALQESYDNAGLIVGSFDMEINAALVCLDSTPEVVREAIDKKANLIIAHHPIVFGGLKKLNGKTHVEKAVMLAIKHDIAIYAIHTNLDNVLNQGVNQKIAQKLGLKNLKILQPKKGVLRKLVVYCPASHADEVRAALFSAGAGHIGQYDSCSFNSHGKGTFRAGESAQPFTGEKGQLHTEEEIRIETIVPHYLSGAVLRAMTEAHPYEEVAYDLYPLDNAWPEAGAGICGEFDEPLPVAGFLDLLKKNMQIPMVRYTKSRHTHIRKLALCGGSGSFLLRDAISSGAQAFLSSDFKYHQFFEAENEIMIADVGHYEGEYFTIELLVEVLTKKFNTFAVIFSGINTNPIKYFC